MSAPDLCIGWPGDCNAWGPNTGMHGCHLTTEHHGDHQCLCGHIAPGYQRRKKAT